jgi:hypothetical protein
VGKNLLEYPGKKSPLGCTNPVCNRFEQLVACGLIGKCKFNIPPLSIPEPYPGPTELSVHMPGNLTYLVTWILNKTDHPDDNDIPVSKIMPINPST